MTEPGDIGKMMVTEPSEEETIGEVLTIGEVRGGGGQRAVAGQREGNAGRAARKLADQRRKWPQEAVSTELPGGWRCPWFSVGHL